MHTGKLKKIIYVLLCILPFILGVIGYCMEHERLIDSLYDSFALYAINPVSDATNWLIIVAKWGAPLVLASGILIILQDVLNSLHNYFISLKNDATAVYSDNEYGNIMKNNLNHGILVTDGQLRDVSDYILLFSKDMDNLNFYQKNKDALKGKNVYIQLNDIDSFLLRENTPHFFHINELIARKFWKDYHLLSYFEKSNKVVKIAIIGFSSLGQQLLNYGLLNNIYDLNQQIEYHIWGESCLYKHLREHMDLMNRDQIIYHGTDWADDVQQFVSMQRIIVAEENRLDLLQTLLYMCSESEIYYYNSGEAVLEDIYKQKLISFGNYADILTEQNIKNEELYRAAKELNYKYACLYGSVSGEVTKKEQELEEQWALLDGFTKGSNIASADYHEIRRFIMENRKEEQEKLTADILARMEHIRWCRYHYLNHWKYGVPENGKNKDISSHIHVCLVLFDELSEEEQKKNYDAVKVLLDLLPV